MDGVVFSQGMINGWNIYSTHPFSQGMINGWNIYSIHSPRDGTYFLHIDCYIASSVNMKF